MGNAPRPSRTSEVIAMQPSYQQLHTTNLSMVPEIELEVHIHKASFKLLPKENLSSLSFSYDATDVCLVTVYYFGVEVMNKQQDHTDYFAVDTKKFPPPSSFRLPKGINQSFPENASIIDLNQYAFEILTCEGRNQHALVVTIKPENENKGPYESTFVRIDKEKESWKASAIRQKIHFQDKSYFLSEIYGLAAESEENVCVVCLTDRRKVTMMPCKHLCLCEECAGILAGASVKKCPVCRTGKLYVVVNELLFIEN
jgi:hypothetical protein